MSDSDKEVPVPVPVPLEEGAARGADWEVVTLTASTYAAAPSGPEGAAEGTRLGDGRGGSSTTLLMSDHFVFPPSEHENLPIETALLDPPQESTSLEDAGFKNVGGGYDDGSETVKYYDEGKSLSVHDAEMMMGDVAEFHAEDDGRGYVVHDDDDDDDSQDKSDVPPLDSSSKGRGSGAPCQCWLKKHMSCLYDQAKDTNHLWGAVVVAALVGLVILWRKDKLHMSCLKWRSRSAVS